MSKLIEIERKFLVLSDNYKSEAYRKTRIVQGFLNSDKDRTVRVRIREDKAYLTIKGISNDRGTSRFEWEREIEISDAQALLNLAEDGRIDKTRFEIRYNDHVFEVDEFYGENEGLIIAEVELQSEDEVFEKPAWIGEEVTGQSKYYNSQLSKLPYTKWS